MAEAERTTLLEGTEGQGTTQTGEGTKGAGTTKGEGNDGSKAGGGKPQSPGWKSGLSAEVKDNPLFKDMSTVTDLAQAHIALNQRMAGSITKPGDKATKEELDAYYMALGKPQDTNGYQFDPNTLPEALRQDKDYDAYMRQTFYDANLTSAQAALIHERLGKRMQEGLKAVEAQKQAATEAIKKETISALSKELGQQFPVKLQAANAAMTVVGRDIGFPNLGAEAKKDGVIHKAWMVKVFMWIADKIHPDTAAPGDGAQQLGGGDSSKMRYPGLRKMLNMDEN